MPEKKERVSNSVENLVCQMKLPWVDLECVKKLSPECRKFYFNEQLEQVITLLILEYHKLRTILGDISKDPTDACFDSISLEDQVDILIKAFSNLEIGFHSFLNEPEIIRAQQALWEKGIVGIDPSSAEGIRIRQERDQELEFGLSKIWLALRMLGKDRPLGRKMMFGNPAGRNL